jgi:hypothetical protein
MNIAEIKSEMTTAFVNDEAVQQLYSIPVDDNGKPQKTFDALFSKVSVENLLFYVFALCAWAFQKKMEAHTADIEAMLAAQRAHTLLWYRTKALAFRYGQALQTDSDTYDDTDLDEDDIAEMQIITQASVLDTQTESGVVIKVATTATANDADGYAEGSLRPLDSNQLAAFESYISTIKDAGVRTTIVSARPDRITLALRVYVDPTVIDPSSGLNVQTGEASVENAIETYLQNLPFDGELVLASLVDALQAVEGVSVPHVDVARSAAFDISASGGYADFQDIDIRTTPQSGYFAISFDGADAWASSITYLYQ